MRAFVAFLASVVVVVTWSYNHLAGIRTSAVISIAAAGYSLYTGRIPLSFNDRYLRDITGMTAFCLSWVAILISAFILVYPESLAPYFHPIAEYVRMKD